MLFQPEILRYLERNSLTRIEPRAALIDMDGTLYDSMKNHTAAWHRLISEAGIPCNRDELYLYEGRTGADTIDAFVRRAWGRAATEQEKTDMYRRKTEYFAALPPVEPMPGGADMLAVLAGAGLRRVLVTGSGQNSLISRLDADFPGMFAADMRVTSRDVTCGKPHPEPFLRAMQLAHATPGQCIVIENAPLGVEAGVRAGAFTVAVTTGPIPLHELAGAGADLVFPSMPAFARALPTLLLTMPLTSLAR